MLPRAEVDGTNKNFMNNAGIFILSDVRSGSTLLDQCLGGHSAIVSLGEVHWLSAYLGQNRSLYNPDHALVCSCGTKVAACPFWNAVNDASKRPTSGLRLNHGLNRVTEGPRLLRNLRNLPRRFVKSHSEMYRNALVRAVLGSRRLAKDSLILFDAVSAVTGKRFCVDSSKSPFRFLDAYAHDSTRAFAIILARDYRAVVYSKMKRGQSMPAAARGWRQKMEQIRILTEDVSPDRVIRVRYEDFCTDPRQELGRLCEFLRIDFEESMLMRATADVHHLGGSPSKYDPGRIQIRLDTSHEGAFSVDESDRMRSIVGDVATQWGY